MPTQLTKASSTRYALTPSDPDFSRLDRHIGLAMPSDSRYWQEEYYKQTIVAHGLVDKTDDVLQVNSRHHGAAGFPDNGIDPEDVNAIESGIQSRASTWSRKPFAAAYYDHEPQIWRDDGSLVASWSGRSRYTSADAEFMNRAMKELAQLGLPMSSYGVPRVPKTTTMDFFRISGLYTAKPLLRGCSWVQLNYYIHPNWSGVGDRVSPAREAGLRASIRQSVPLFASIFSDQQLVPILWPRYGGVPNRHWFEICFEEFERFPELIKNIVLWTNPHSDRTFGGSTESSVMTRVYAEKFDEVSSVVKAWLGV